MGKKDKGLGIAVHNYLRQVKVESPKVFGVYDAENDDSFRSEYRIEDIKTRLEYAALSIGLSPKDPSHKETPERVAKMYVKELFWGLDYTNFPRIMKVPNAGIDADQMIVEVNIPVKSMCEHHLMPIRGVCHVAYFVNDSIVGLSKLNRIVEFFSRRPQVQERLMSQIYYALRLVLGTESIAVFMDCEHFCVSHRGVNHDNSTTITSKIGGIFMDKPHVKQELQTHIASLRSK